MIFDKLHDIRNRVINGEFVQFGELFPILIDTGIQIKTFCGLFPITVTSNDFASKINGIAIILEGDELKDGTIAEHNFVEVMI